MQNVVKIFRQTFWQILSRFSTTISGIIILGIIARNYGEDGVGNFSLSLLYILFFHSLIDFGLNAHVIKKMTGKEDVLQWRKLLGIRLIMASFFTFVAFLLIYLFPSPRFTNDFKLAAFFALATIPLYAIKITNLSLIQAKLKYGIDVFPTAFGSLLCIVFVWYLSSLKSPIYLLALGYVVSFFIQAFAPIFLNINFFKSFKPIFNLNILMNLIKTAWPLAATLILNIIYFRVDSFLLAFFKGSSEVGLYNLGFQFFQTILILPTFIMNSFYPMLLKTFKENVSAFRAQVKVAFITLFFLSIAVLVSTLGLSEVFVKVVAGEDFQGSVVTLKILSLSFPAFFLTSCLMWLIIIKNVYKQMFLIYLLGLAFNFFANLYYIPKYSYVGASVITVASEYLILALLAVVLWSKQKRNK